MGVRKNDGADLTNEYPIWVQVGMVLMILITAFRANWQQQQDFEVQLEEQEVVEMEEIQQTKQEVKPPPPPKPPVPVEVPNDEVIEEDVDFDASLDLNESLDTSQGPPEPPEDKGEEEEEEIFVIVENEPDCGGVQALQSKVEYPEFAKKAGIEGRVFIQFVVDENGNVTNPTVTRGVHKLLDQEAVSAVKELSCTPGKQRGKPVKVRMSLPVTFRLQ